MNTYFARNVQGVLYRLIYYWFIDDRVYFVWKGKSLTSEEKSHVILETVQSGETIATKQIYPSGGGVI